MREGDFTLSADGGGSKLAAVMFDDAFHFRAAGYGGPVNGSFSETEKGGRSRLRYLPVCPRCLQEGSVAPFCRPHGQEAGKRKKITIFFSWK